MRQLFEMPCEPTGKGRPEFVRDLRIVGQLEYADGGWGLLSSVSSC